jgi:hypothetical protein
MMAIVRIKACSIVGLPEFLDRASWLNQAAPDESWGKRVRGRGNTNEASLRSFAGRGGANDIGKLASLTAAAE